MLFMAMHKHGAERVCFVLGIFESLNWKLMYLSQNMTVTLLKTMKYIYPRGFGFEQIGWVSHRSTKTKHRCIEDNAALSVMFQLTIFIVSLDNTVLQSSAMTITFIWLA